MEINADINRLKTNGFKIEITHGDEILRFPFAIFNKANFSIGNNVFKQINAFWKHKGPRFEDAVFKIYKEIDETFNDILNKNHLEETLMELVTQLYELHSFKEVKEWMLRYSGLPLPEGFDENYREDIDRKTTEDKTYLRSDERDLTAFSLFLRPMVPIWAKYTKNVRHHSGNFLKEQHSWKLLENTEVPELEAVHKLLRYIRAKLKKDNMTLPVSFISEEDFPYWLMTVNCVRKISVTDLAACDRRANLVTLVHNSISAQTGYQDGDFSTVERTKTPEFGDDDNKISTMEAFRVSMDIAVAPAAELSFSVEDLERTKNLVAVDLDPELLKHCVDTSSVLADYPIARPQRAIVSWVLKNAISPAGFDFLDRTKQVELQGLAQAVLWQRGFKYLSLLSTSLTTFTQEHRVSVAPTKERMPAELLVSIRRVFPHVRVTPQRKSEAKEECRVISDIETIVDDLFNSVWQPTASEAMLKEVLGDDASKRRIHIRSDIRAQLASLAIAVGEDKISNPF